MTTEKEIEDQRARERGWDAPVGPRLIEREILASHARQRGRGRLRSGPLNLWTLSVLFAIGLLVLFLAGCADADQGAVGLGAVGLGPDGQLSLFAALTVMSVVLWLVKSVPTRVLSVLLAVPAIVVAVELWM